MFQVSNGFIEECEKNMQTKNKLGKIVILDGDIEITESNDLQNFKIENNIYSSDTFIGSTIKRKLTANIINVNKTYNFENKEISVETGINIEGIPEYVPFGNFIVEKPKNKNTKLITSIIAYDYMIKFDIPFILNISLPCTIRQLVQSICNYCGVILSDVSFTNENFIITTIPYTSENSCTYILQDITEKICGGYAKIGRDNKLYIKNLDNKPFNNTSKTVSDIHIISVAELNTTKIKELYRKSDLNINGNNYIEIQNISDKFGPIDKFTYISNSEDLDNVILGDGINELRIQASPFVATQQQMQELANEIWKKVKGLEYVPIKVKSYGFPYSDDGDKMIVYDNEDSEYKTLLFNHTFIFNGSFSSDFETQALTKVQQEYRNQNTMGELIKKSQSSLLELARQNATQLITEFNGGYVIKKDGELYIADNLNLDEAVRLWRWNINGLAYSNTGINGEYGIAMTMDGSIVADFITSGTMSADRIFGGTLEVGGNENTGGIITVKDNEGQVVVIIDKDGVTLSNGARLIGGNGVLSTFQFSSGDWQNLGIKAHFAGTSGSERTPVHLSAFMPINFEIISAKLRLYHAPKYWRGLPVYGDRWCGSTNIRLYKTSNINNYYGYGVLNSDLYGENDTSERADYTEIISAFGVSGFTATLPTVIPPATISNTVETRESIELNTHLISGVYNYLKLETADIPPDMDIDPDLGIAVAFSKTGLAMATLTVIGYMKQ